MRAARATAAAAYSVVEIRTWAITPAGTGLPSSSSRVSSSMLATGVSASTKFGDAVQVGTPTVAGATVSAKITGQYRGTKIMVFKYRPKSGYKRARGHRQHFTQVRITGISA